MYKVIIAEMTSNYSNKESQIIEIVKSETLKDAKKVIKTLIKKYSLIRHAGYIVNFSSQLELSTNF